VFTRRIKRRLRLLRDWMFVNRVPNDPPKIAECTLTFFLQAAYKTREQSRQQSYPNLADI